MDLRDLNDQLKVLDQLKRKSSRVVEKPPYMEYLMSLPFARDLSKEQLDRINAEVEIWYSDDAIEERATAYFEKVFAEREARTELTSPREKANSVLLGFSKIFSYNSMWDLPQFQIDALTAMCVSHLGIHPNKGIDTANGLPFNSDKGVMIAGKSQVGKTTVFTYLKSLQWFSFRIVTSSQLTEMYERMGSAVIDEYGGKGKCLMIDEVGWEEEGRYMGNRMDVVAEVIHRRHAKGLKTHMTSNLSLEALEERYKPHIVTRIQKLCNIIYAKNDDKQFI